MVSEPDVQTTAGQERLRERGIRPRPVPDDVTRPYWDAAAEHRLCIARCANCGRFRHPPTATCPVCSSSSVEWTDLNGRGTVYSFIVDYRNMVPGFEGPYVVAQVNPVDVDEELVRIVANIRDCAIDDVHIGMPVRVTFDDLEPGLALPQFVPDP